MAIHDFVWTSWLHSPAQRLHPRQLSSRSQVVHSEGPLGTLYIVVCGLVCMQGYLWCHPVGFSQKLESISLH